MKYLVMECALSYAVLLDSDGRFLKVPNLGYEVGQVLNETVIGQKHPSRVRARRLMAIAACLCLVFFGGWQFWRMPVGAVRLQINPDVQIEVNYFDRVVGIEALNRDGEELLRGYCGYGQSPQMVSVQLADRAVQKGYLKEGGRILLTVQSDREDWKEKMEQTLMADLKNSVDRQIEVSAKPPATSEESDQDTWEEDPDEPEEEEHENEEPTEDEKEEEELVTPPSKEPEEEEEEEEEPDEEHEGKSDAEREPEEEREDGEEES